MRKRLQTPEPEALEPILHRAYEDWIMPAASDIDVEVLGGLSVWLIRSGSVEVTPRGMRRRLEAGPGEWLVNSPSCKRRQTFKPGARLLSLNLSILNRDFDPVFDAGLPVSFAAKAHPPLEEAALRCARVVDVARARSNASPYDLVQFLRFSIVEGWQIRAALCEFAVELHAALAKLGIEPRKTPEEDARISAAKSVIGHGEFLSRIPYDRLGAMTGLGRRHIDRMFKEMAGMTPKQYMERACVKRSALMLREYGQSVKFVAYTLRFHSPSHFVTWFRRQTGLTPREFAMRHR